MASGAAALLAAYAVDYPLVAAGATGVNNFLLFNQTAGHWASTPDKAGWDLSGDAMWRFSVHPLLDTASGILFARYLATGNDRSWRFEYSSGTNGLVCLIGTGTGTLRTTIAYNGLGDVLNDLLQVELKIDADNGSGNTSCQWRSRTYDADIQSASGWAADEEDILAGVQTWKATAQPVTVAGDPAGANLYGHRGLQYYHWSDLTLTTRLSSWDVTDTDQLTDTPPSYLTWTDDDGNAWTVQSAGVEYHFPVAASCTATIDDPTTAGVQRAFEVTTIDNQNDPFPYGGHTVTIAITGPNAGNLTVTDVGDGTYTANDTPTASTTDSVAITFDGGAISGSPFSPDVVPAAISPADCTSNTPATATSGTVVNVTVQAKDAFGNNLTAGGATVVATLGGVETGTPTVTDVGNGTYTFSFTPVNAGAATLAITANATPISGSTYNVDVAPSPSQTTASGPATVDAGNEVEYTIQTKDSEGDNYTAGGDTVQGEITGPNSAIVPDVVDNLDGTYTLTYTPTAGGSDSLAVTLNGTAISGSPYSVEVSVGVAISGRSGMAASMGMDI